jgi:capsular exopolysaccharide synthesis family protein
VLLVSSCSPREGKTTVASNLALVFAQDGKRTLLVDADLRKPRVHEVMGVDSARGLSNVLVGRERPEDVVLPTAHENLWVLPAGTLPPNPAELLGRPAVRTLFDALRSSFDRIVVDSAPVGIVTDAAVLARVADTVLLVVAAGRTKKRSAEHGAALLATVGSPATGVIMNMVPRGSRWAYGGYYDRGSRGYYGSSGDAR